MFDLKFTEENKPVVIYLGQQEIDVIIYMLNPWDVISDKIITHRFHNFQDWVVFTLDSENKSKLVIETKEGNYEFILPNTVQKYRSKKIICTGLNRTGTTSLASSLKNMGLKQFPENIGHQFLSHQVIHGSYGNIINSIENIDYDFYEDIPFSFPKVYQHIFKMFPKEKYILTVRNSSEEWAESCIRFYGEALETEKITNFDNSSPYMHEYSSIKKIHVYNWGHPMFRMWGLKNTNNLKKDLKNIYEKHCEDFINFMEINNGDYIIINVSKEGELKKLSKWIGLEVEEENFEHLNKSI